MDLYILFKSLASTPDQYLTNPADAALIDWDRIDDKFYVEGAERVILDILRNAQYDQDVHYYHLF